MQVPRLRRLTGRATATEITDTAALLPRSGRITTVLTRFWPGSRFWFLDPRLRLRNDTVARNTTPECLLDALARVVVNNRDESTDEWVVEPGVGRAALLDGLAMVGRPELNDFVVLGIGRTPYASNDFILKGPDIDGLCSLEKAIHRHRVSEALRALGCRTPETAAIIELPGLLKRLPDGRQTAAALIIRAARTVLRIQQLDPLHGFFHSSLYRIPLTAYIGKQVAMAARY